MEELLFKWIPNVGFPIAVAGFVLIRMEPKLTKLVSAITELVGVVTIDAQNTNGVKEALTQFRIEVGKINGNSKK